MSETDDSIFMTEDDYREGREEQLRAEITSLRSQLEALGTQIAQHESLAHGYTDEIAQLQCRVEEARRKAIEECLALVDATAGYWRNDCAEGRSAICVTSVCEGISESIRALLSGPTEARSVLEASNKGGE